MKRKIDFLCTIFNFDFIQIIIFIMHSRVVIVYLLFFSNHFYKYFLGQSKWEQLNLKGFFYRKKSKVETVIHSEWMKSLTIVDTACMFPILNIEDYFEKIFFHRFMKFNKNWFNQCRKLQKVTELKKIDNSKWWFWIKVQCERISLNNICLQIRSIQVKYK